MFENRVKKFENRVKKGEESVCIDNDADIHEGASKAYEKPILVSYGDVRDITLGPTNGEGESGAALFFRVPPPP